MPFNGIFFYSRASPSMADFVCPKCNQGIEIENWDTDCGHPISSDFDLICPNCGQTITILVDVIIKIKVI